jgi:hypothetical protein
VTSSVSGMAIPSDTPASIALPQLDGRVLSWHVVLRLAMPGAVVIWFVTALPGLST